MTKKLNASRAAMVANALGQHQAQASNVQKAKEILAEKHDAVNDCGRAAFDLSDFEKLYSLLSTEKLELTGTFYQPTDERIQRLKELVTSVGMKDPELLAKLIVYVRCHSEGLRTVTALAAALAAPFVNGQPWAKDFYGPFCKRTATGGMVFRADVPKEIIDFYTLLNKKTIRRGNKENTMAPNRNLPAAMRKGFAEAIKSFDLNTMAKYKQPIIDAAELVHVNPEECRAKVEVTPAEYTKLIEGRYNKHTCPKYENGRMSALSYVMLGGKLVADTKEANKSELGQIYAEKVKSGEMTKEEADEKLNEGKKAITASMLADGRLPINTALQSINELLELDNLERSTVDAYCKLLTNENMIKRNLVLPHQFDAAMSIIQIRFAGHRYANALLDALNKGYESSIPNLREKLKDEKIAVILDRSGSMAGRPVAVEETPLGYGAKNWQKWNHATLSSKVYNVWNKATLMAGTLIAATGADCYVFANDASQVTIKSNLTAFEIANKLRGMGTSGCTNLDKALSLCIGKDYTKIIVISDGDINCGEDPQRIYAKYVLNSGLKIPTHIYISDMCAYGTSPLRGDDVSLYAGSGNDLYNALAMPSLSKMEAFAQKIKSLDLKVRYR